MANTYKDHSIPLMEQFTDEEEYLKRSSLDETPQFTTTGFPQNNNRSNVDNFLLSPKTHSFNRYRTYASLLAIDIKKAIYTLIIFLIPSFFRIDTPESTSRQQAPRIRYKTTYLDGLRGVAALLVVCHHYFPDRFPRIKSGWTADQTPYANTIWQLPFFRIVVAGAGMVSIFFVISGFALSYKPLGLIHQRQDARFLDALASAIFRRPFRLYMPIIAITFAQMLHLWFWETPYLMSFRQDSFGLQVWHWYIVMLKLSNPFRRIDVRAIYDPPYNVPLWTIPFEFRGSTVIFGTLLLFSRTKTYIRIPLLFAIIIYTFNSFHWDLFLFLSGCLIADLHHLRAKYFEPQTARHSNISLASGHDPELDSIPKFLRMQASGRKFLKTPIYYASRVFAILSFLILIHILMFPTKAAATSYGYKALTRWTPSSWAEIIDLGRATGAERFWLSIASVLLVLLVDCSSLLQRPFTTRFAQYLGNISYAIYVVHVPVFFGVGDMVTWQVKWVELIVYGPLLFWAADVFWRGVDMNSVRFAGWVYGKCRVVDEDRVGIE